MPTPHPADEATLRVSADHTPRAPVNLAQFSPGTLIAGRYRIVSLLGSGGMGEVYRADDIKLGQVVALKFLPAALARDPVLLARLHDEVRLGRQVSHPNVCRIYDIGEFGHAHFVAMEYVDGEDLARLLRRIGRVSHDKGIELAHGVAAGLAAAHAKGILHRDLKPANVMIDGHGNPRITDFGLALGFEDSGFADAAGTPAYMAPEQLEGRAASVQSDLYALGLVMYEMFTGRRPYSGRSVAELRDVISSADTQPPSSHVRDLEPVVEQVILRCLSRDPAQRPRSAREVLESLPGGDPLAAALAAGETPSPRMVAAAGSEGSLRRAQAWAWLGAFAALLAAAIAVNARWRIMPRISFELPPAVLTQRAAEIAHTLGLPAASYRVGDLETDYRYLAWVNEHDRSPSRFSDLRHGPPPVTYVVRMGAAPLTPRDATVATADDPPLAKPGDALLRVDTAGRLVALSAVPRTAPGGGAADWNRLLALAGFEPAALRRVAPRELPPHFADERAAWEGVWPGAPSRTVRVEAAAAAGVPVWFHLSGPWETAGAETRMAFGNRWSLVISSIAVTLIACCIVLGWRNFRQRRGDRAGAFRLAAAVCTAITVSDLLPADYAGGMLHLAKLLVVALREGLLYGVVAFIVYLALEPQARRRWPERMIAWTRLLAGNPRDPMVGRDLLIGLTCGTLHAALAALTNWLPGAMGWSLPAMPHASYLTTLLGIRYALSMIVSAAVSGLLFGFLPLLILIGLTILVRRRKVAAVLLYIVLQTLYLTAARGNPYILAAAVVIAMTWTLLTVRVGLLATVAAHFAFILGFQMPTAIDFGSWAAASLILPLLLLAALAVYGFRTALGNQPAFSGALLDD